MMSPIQSGENQFAHALLATMRCEAAKTMQISA